MGKLSSILGFSLAMMSSAQTTGKSGYQERFTKHIPPFLRKTGRMKNRKLNPEGYRGKPTKRRLKVKLARKAKLRNQRNG